MNKKRIYVAAPWIARAEAKEFANVLHEIGYEITMNWWDYESEARGLEKDTENYAKFLHMCATKDLRGVRTADAVVLMNSSKSEGKAVEQGIAIALGIPIIAIGKLGEHSQNVFHYLPLYHWVANQKDALYKLKEVLGGV